MLKQWLMIWIKRIANMQRLPKQMLMAVLDALLLLFAVWAAYSLRLGHCFIPSGQQCLLLAAAPALAIPIFVKMGLYHSVIRYLGEHALWMVLKSVSLATLLWVVLAFMTQMMGVTGIPRAVPLLYWLLAVVAVAGVRFFARWFLRLPWRTQHSGRHVLIYGAGSAGRQLVASLLQGREFLPVGFLDDDPSLHGKEINSLRVYDPEQLRVLIQRFAIGDVIVTLPSASHARRKQIVLLLEQHRVRARILPALADIANGRHLVSLLREVDIGDLLGRDTVVANPALLAQCIQGKSVLVTGAGGSIGAELCRQIVLLKPTCLVLLESSEHALYQIDRALRAVTELSIITCLGSAEDARLLTGLFTQHGIQTVYHAAAYKHVPLVESNCIEGVRNNVLSTWVLAQAAFVARVETFVLISTDKAVRPTSVMGASKRVAELIVQDFARQAVAAGLALHFCAVRFGNVLGSSGSVIPLFKEQITGGGPVTVTHAEVTRYFMSIHEAVELVIQAGSLATGGEVFLLDMGEPVKIIDLARNMIRLAGYTVRDDATPDGDIEIAVTGLRPGEKLYEELLIVSSNAAGTSHPKIMQADEPCLSHEEIVTLLDGLRDAIACSDEPLLRQRIMHNATPCHPEHRN